LYTSCVLRLCRSALSNEIDLLIKKKKNPTIKQPNGAQPRRYPRSLCSPFDHNKMEKRMCNRT
jgi:hypothetical protein